MTPGLRGTSWCAAPGPSTGGAGVAFFGRGKITMG